LAISARRSSVTSKKNFSPVSVAFSVMGEAPASTMCSWKLRRSSALAVSGDEFKKAASLRTARRYALRV